MTLERLGLPRRQQKPVEVKEMRGYKITLRHRKGLWKNEVFYGKSRKRRHAVKSAKRLCTTFSRGRWDLVYVEREKTPGLYPWREVPKELKSKTLWAGLRPQASGLRPI